MPQTNSDVSPAPSVPDATLLCSSSQANFCSGISSYKVQWKFKPDWRIGGVCRLASTHETTLTQGGEPGKQGSASAPERREGKAPPASATSVTGSLLHSFQVGSTWSYSGAGSRSSPPIRTALAVGGDTRGRGAARGRRRGRAVGAQRGRADFAGSDAPRLLDAFQRGVPDESGRSAGLGLGLYIVQQIVEAHGGTVTVRSGAGEGTTFTVRFPES